MLNRLRAGIELCYWMHVGGRPIVSTMPPAILLGERPLRPRTSHQTQESRPEPMANHDSHHGTAAERNGSSPCGKDGARATSLAFNYGAIEGEPSFPMTNFGGKAAFNAGAARAPGGVVGNAQTHCVQLPNTFAFARGARGSPSQKAITCTLPRACSWGRG